MKRLGELLYSTRSGLIIVKSAYKDPRRLLGALVYDRDMKRIGRIVDVIGPVSSPFIVVKPESREIVGVVEPGPVYYYVERRFSRRRKVFKRSSRKYGR